MRAWKQGFRNSALLTRRSALFRGRTPASPRAGGARRAELRPNVVCRLGRCVARALRAHGTDQPAVDDHHSTSVRRQTRSNFGMSQRAQACHVVPRARTRAPHFTTCRREPGAQAALSSSAPEPAPRRSRSRRYFQITGNSSASAPAIARLLRAPVRVGGRLTAFWPSVRGLWRAVVGRLSKLEATASRVAEKPTARYVGNMGAW